MAPGKYKSLPYEAVVGTEAQEVITDLEYVGFDAEVERWLGSELADDTPVLPGEGAPWGLFFQGWKPFPTAASARGGGDLLLSLLH